MKVYLKNVGKAFESLIYISLSMEGLGLSGKDSKNFYYLLKMTLKLEEDQTNYLIRKITSYCIRITYFIFCKNYKSRDKPDLPSR